MTPLQVVIAKNIIKERGGNSYFGLYITYHDNEKNKYYYNILKEICHLTSFILLEGESFTKKLNTFYTFQKHIKNLSLFNQYIEYIFLASVDNIFVQYIVSKVSFNKLITFDDGTANIFQNSVYFIQQKQAFLKIIFTQLLGIRYNNIDNMKKISSLHYTIYPSEKNIIDNVKVINIFPSLSNIDRNKKYANKRIILGQPLEGFIGANNYRKIVLTLSKNLNIDYYFPHPREITRFDDMLTVIDSCLIIEDYLIRELSINFNINFEIYTFFSSAVLSLNSFERVEVNTVSSTLLMENFSEAYQFFIDRDINLINLDEWI